MHLFSDLRKFTCTGRTLVIGQEVRAAYKQAAFKWHPDRKHNHDNVAEATKKFQEARAAFEMLRKA